MLMIGISAALLLILHSSFAQSDELEFNIDVKAAATALPKIFKPGVDLSGRGFHEENTWPQGAAAKVTLDAWQQDIGFSGIYRLQYNLWEINELAKDKELQQKLLSSYESIIKNINDSQGILILDIFSTPAGLGKVLDKKSSPWDLRAFKALVKQTIQYLSCEKKYNVWYEVWSAPDVDDFYLGREQEYLNLYRAVAEAVDELKKEYKIHIPVGGPSISWWFQNIEGNTIITPERSLIYELIRFCARYRLPLDFISWHGYSTDPRIEKELTRYNKTGVALIRDWLTYFHLNRETPLIVDEWNYDSGANILAQRHERSNICASYILSRLKNMYEAGLDYQVYFSLEDFHGNKEGVSRNVGLFWFDQQDPRDKRGAKSTYNIFRMLSLLGKDMLEPSLKSSDGFVDILVTKSDDYLALLIYNYSDPEIAMNYISRNIASLNDAERKIIVRLIKSRKLDKLIRRELEPASLRLTKKLKSVLKKAQELNDQAVRFANSERSAKINIKNLNGDYLRQIYTIDSTCALNCDFAPAEEKTVNIAGAYLEGLVLKPYSVNLLVFKKKPPEPAAPQEAKDGREKSLPEHKE